MPTGGDEDNPFSFRAFSSSSVGSTGSKSKASRTSLFDDDDDDGDDLFASASSKPSSKATRKASVSSSAAAGSRAHNGSNSDDLDIFAGVGVPPAAAAAAATTAAALLNSSDEGEGAADDAADDDHLPVGGLLLAGRLAGNPLAASTLPPQPACHLMTYLSIPFRSIPFHSARRSKKKKKDNPFSFSKFVASGGSDEQLPISADKSGAAKAKAKKKPSKPKAGTASAAGQVVGAWTS